MSHIFTAPRRDFASEFATELHQMRRSRLRAVSPEARARAIAKLREAQERRAAKEAGVDYEPMSERTEA